MKPRALAHIALTFSVMLATPAFAGKAKQVSYGTFKGTVRNSSSQNGGPPERSASEGTRTLSRIGNKFTTVQASDGLLGPTTNTFTGRIVKESPKGDKLTVVFEGPGFRRAVESLMMGLGQVAKAKETVHYSFDRQGNLRLEGKGEYLLSAFGSQDRLEEAYDGDLTPVK